MTGALLAFLLLLAPCAHALTTSPNAFRLEDSRQGNLLLGADSAKIEAGEVYGTVVLLWGNLDIYGQADEVLVLSGKVTFHPGARLNKSLIVMGGSFESKAGSKVAPEDVIYRAPGPLWRLLQSAGNIWRDNINWVMKAVAAVIFCLLLWGLGLLLFFLAPALQDVTEKRLLRDWPQNLIVGWFGTLFVPVFLVLLVISVFGIVLVPFYLLLLLAVGLVTYLAAALWAGHRLLPPKRGVRINPWGFLLGLMALQLLWASGVWWGWLPAFFLWSLSWGGLLRGARKLWK
jgi:hypothetical protein